jgi:hypothetical protein
MCHAAEAARRRQFCQEIWFCRFAFVVVVRHIGYRTDMLSHRSRAIGDADEIDDEKICS